MKQTNFSITTDVAAPQSLVWSVMADVTRWPEWAESVLRVRLLSPGPLQVGSRVRIHQPKLPPAYWRVTELDPGASFTWISRVPGVRVTARHAVEEIGDGVRVNLSIHYAGWLGGWLAGWTGALNDRYLGLEANGLKAHCTHLAARLASELRTR